MRQKSELQYSTMRLTVVVIFLTTLIQLASHAQDSAGVKAKWNFLAEPYLMIPNLNGTLGVGSLPDADVDADAGDIFGNFKIGGMLYFEAATKKWAFSSDLIYLKLGQDAVPGKIIRSGEVDVEQFSWELAGLRKFLPVLDAGIGFRLNNLSSGLYLETNNIGGGTTVRFKSLTETWVDPIIIARFKNAPGKKFIYQLRGDLGGFGIGSEFAWQIQADAGYRFSKLFQVTAGYRIISVDYDKGSAENRFKYDVNTFGPVIRLGFNF